MATVNFSVPDEVKDAFNRVFAKENKSAIIASLMREAVDRVEARNRAREAASRIVERRKHAPLVTEAECEEARERYRP